MAASPPSLAAMKGHDRVLLVFAPDAHDRFLEAQREITRDSGFAERDLRLVTVVGDRVEGATEGAAGLRSHYHVEGHGFRALLIGKDGHVADRQNKPFAARALFATIDAMPMRQDEMRRR